MTDVLFVTFDGGGNLPPALGLAAELERRGGRVRFLGNRVQRERIEQAGFSFQPSQHGVDFDAAAPRSTVTGVLDMSRLVSDPGLARDVVGAAAAQPTDAVVVDALLYRAIQEGVKAGLAVVQLIHTVSAYFDQFARGPFGMICRLRGANPSAALRAPRLNLVVTRKEFDPGAPSGTVHTGFLWQGTPVEATPNPTPRILVSFSTTDFPGQAEVLQRTIDGLGALDAEVIVTTGPSIDPATVRPATNTTVRRFVDHGDLLPETSLVVSHGGHSTVSRALSYGIPLLVLPMHPLLDQSMVGKAVQEQGVGLSISRKSSSTSIRAGAERLLHDDATGDAARALGRAIRERDGATTAADLVEDFVRTGEGVLR